MNTALVFASEEIGTEALLAEHLSDLHDRIADVHVIAIATPDGLLPAILRRLDISHEVIGHLKLSPKIRKQVVSKADYLLAFWDGRSLSEVLFEARLQKKPTKLVPIPTAVIVNKDRGDQYDFYIGRGTPWGNPYVVGVGEGQFSREEAIEKYRQHFHQNILTDPQRLRGLLGLRGSRLACHCKPLACHGDVIAAYLNSLEPEDETDSHSEPRRSIDN